MGSSGKPMDHAQNDLGDVRFRDKACLCLPLISELPEADEVESRQHVFHHRHILPPLTHRPLLPFPRPYLLHRCVHRLVVLLQTLQRGLHRTRNESVDGEVDQRGKGHQSNRHPLCRRPVHEVLYTFPGLIYRHTCNTPLYTLHKLIPVPLHQPKNPYQRVHVARVVETIAQPLVGVQTGQTRGEGGGRHR